MHPFHKWQTYKRMGRPLTRTVCLGSPLWYRWGPQYLTTLRRAGGQPQGDRYLINKVDTKPQVRSNFDVTSFLRKQILQIFIVGTDHPSNGRTNRPTDGVNYSYRGATLHLKFSHTIRCTPMHHVPE
jgi:hypothetical protein